MSSTTLLFLAGSAPWPCWCSDSCTSGFFASAKTTSWWMLILSSSLPARAVTLLASTAGGAGPRALTAPGDVTSSAALLSHTGGRVFENRVTLSTGESTPPANRSFARCQPRHLRDMAYRSRASGGGGVGGSGVDTRRIAFSVAGGGNRVGL